MQLPAEGFFDFLTLMQRRAYVYAPEMSSSEKVALIKKGINPSFLRHLTGRPMETMDDFVRIALSLLEEEKVTVATINYYHRR